MHIIHQHSLEVFANSCAHVSRDRDSSLLYIFEAFFDTLSLIEIGAGEHFIENHSQSPDITFLRIHIINVGFRRHVSGGTHIVKHLRLGIQKRGLIEFTVAEVNDLWN